MSEWQLSDLEAWDDRIREKVAEFGLDCYPQEFEVCDQEAMLGYMAYHGMPSHYPHWSFGKSFEQLKTRYTYGVSGLPYEMVINSNPCLAYLMRDNTLCLQVLTIAHVYGHNDFFKNNFTFASATHAEDTLGSFKARADRVRRYIEDPSIGGDEIEAFLDAAHALSLNRSPNATIPRFSPADQRQRLIEAARPAHDPFRHLHREPEPPEPDLDRVPLEPDQNVLLFIRDHRPDLADWQKDLLTICDEEARYFIPQMETKIMNEGWASYWHHKIMTSLDLPDSLRLEFMVRHSQVICPHPGGLNPYHVGYVVWHDIEKRFGGEGSKEGRAKMFEVRESDRDVAFLRRFLTPELMRELDLFSYKTRGEHLVVDEIADDEGWEPVKAGLLRQIGVGGMPVIRVVDADYGRRRALFCRHEHDGRDLDMGHAEKTLAHLRQLWGFDVLLETKMRGKRTLLQSRESGFEAKLAG